VDFFFQAEDGIRDFHVTGVQTCALPISLEGDRDHARDHDGLPLCRNRVRGYPQAGSRRIRWRTNTERRGLTTPGGGRLAPALRRSEERRVGKGGGSGWTLAEREVQGGH